MTFREVAVDVLVELGAYGPTDTPNAQDIELVRRMGQRLIDNWNAVHEAIYADSFLTFTITPSLQPHTIGPSTATWTTTQRPVAILGATLVVSSTQSHPLTVRDATWWNDRVDPGYASDVPTDLFYNPTWPNGSVYFWGVAAAAYDVQLWVRTVLAAYELSTTLTMPPGYRDALTLTLKEMCAPSFAKTLSEKEVLDASKARARIFGNNTVIPKLVSPAGLPGGGGTFDYRTGRAI